MVKLLGQLLILFIVSHNVYGKDTVRLIAGYSKPPFVIEEGAKGIQLDIVREALSFDGYNVKFVHIPFGRSVMSLQNNTYDGIVTVMKGLEYPNILLSDPYVRYQNVAVSLSDRKFKINSIHDLPGKTVYTFQRARKHLGEEFEKVVSRSSGYREVAEQEKQVTDLFYRKAEVIILDINIFKHFAKEMSKSRQLDPFVIHPLFDERYYSAGFKDEALKNSFNAGVKKLKESGRYQEILDSYLN